MYAKLLELKRLLDQSPNEYPKDLLDEIIQEVEEKNQTEKTKFNFDYIFGKNFPFPRKEDLL